MPISPLAARVALWSHHATLPFFLEQATGRSLWQFRTLAARSSAPCAADLRRRHYPNRPPRFLTLRFRRAWTIAPRYSLHGHAGSSSTLLRGYSAHDEVIIGVPVANRARPEFEPLIGCFINMVAVRGDLSGNPTFLDLLARTRENCSGGVSSPGSTLL